MFEVSIITFIAGFAGVLIVAAFGLVLRDISAARKLEEANRRLANGDASVVRRVRLPQDEPPPTTVTGKAVQWSNQLMAESGMRWQGEHARLVMLVFGTILGGVLLYVMDSFVWASLGFFFGAVLPLLFFTYRSRSRLAKMADQLPESLYLLARAVRAGESPDQAIALVAAETEAPLGGEFARCRRQLEMGLSLPAAMRSMARRTRLWDLRVFATTLMLHRQTGGNIAVTLERLADVMRNRLEYRRQFRASTAGGRLSMMVIGFVGFVVFLAIVMWKPQYVEQLLASTTGWVVLALAVSAQIVGITWMMSITKSHY